MITSPDYEINTLSKDAINLHFNGHHMKYVENLKTLIGDFDIQQDLLEIIQKHPKEKYTSIYNNAAQIYNHNLYWKSLDPKNFEYYKDILNDISEDIKKLSMEVFGSGWVWVVKRDKIMVEKTSNGDIPVNCEHLWVIDLWEHAYYIDYKNKKKEYIENIMNLYSII